MQTRNLTVIALVVVLGFGLSANALPAARQTAPTGDHPPSPGQAIGDTWITAKVKTVLATTEGIDSAGISVKTMDGVVTLIGVLPTKTAVEKAIAATKSVKGVKDVDASGLKVK